MAIITWGRGQRKQRYVIGDNSFSGQIMPLDSSGNTSLTRVRIWDGTAFQPKPLYTWDGFTWRFNNIQVFQ